MAKNCIRTFLGHMEHLHKEGNTMFFFGNAKIVLWNLV